MATTYEDLMKLEVPDVSSTYSEKDTMFYALSLGAGTDPMDACDLGLVFEKNLQAIPTMAVVLAHPGFWPREQNSGLDWVEIVHGGQRVKLHKSLPVAGKIIGRGRVRDVIDKGEGKGVLVFFERNLFDAETDELLVTMEQTLFCRGDGGMGGSGNQPVAPFAIPDRPADLSVEREVSPQMALLYRLNGDMNPLHADPEIAQKAGFDRPILQGLGTMGVAALALIKTVCEGDPSRMTEVDVRFTAPCFPGETLRTDIWMDAKGAAFRVSVPVRKVTVIDNGRVDIRG
ncbi:3-alpha,7-alpha,12-alpha-trihydroxy-5-beta-cholest-24-enoyl-CoA hydratase [Aestuariicella hydrocarbonica]|uniref:3-alpha,7-alpha, 12-alpha-trihydroxy-5-beta-cholest-24-enoyl-CoA hydratase n=1 Tax=Pseudomaricurvus hydrocarbonicus TaxID=1470433 RepID=A0A9E5JXZ2_9GAMM|nr:MaoC/PaaZ C-terminal domain-containing protein [Aestuariicella hydrocarbonica]NHO66630.1 3-alpha,7-alpha,12-alpha-trihydroxy-5-beta-cholest-24-enoyl-CoA hydratase [Aestuariicella hydrocarbonica]